MDHEIGPWKMAFSHGPTRWSIIHGPISIKKKINLQSLWSPSIGVTRMWTKRIDHAPKVNVLIFQYMPRTGHLKKN